jgi:aspartate/glutamate racemase
MGGIGRFSTVDYYRITNEEVHRRLGGAVICQVRSIRL